MAKSCLDSDARITNRALADGGAAASRYDARHDPCPTRSRRHRGRGARGDGRRAPDCTVLGALSRPYPRGRLSHLGPPMRIANGARRTRDRPQDRFHQPYHLGRIWCIRADVGIRVRRHGQRSPAATPGSAAPAYAGALRRAAHRARDRVPPCRRAFPRHG